MAHSDYGQVRQERVWVTRESTFNVLKQPASRDAIVLRGRAGLPSVMTDFRDSEEVRLTPDTASQIAGKKPPGDFELAVYAKAPSVGGRFPSWGALALDSYGSEIMVLTVLDFAQLETDNATVTVTIAGTANVLTEDAEWQAGASNAAAATSLASAINALSGVSATASGAEVRVTRDTGTGEVVITTSALAADLQLTEIRYALATAILEKSLSLWHLADNILHGYRGCKVSAIHIDLSGSDEGTLGFRGLSGNEVFVGYHTLDGAIVASGSQLDPITFVTNEEPTLQIGPEADDYVVVTIDSEDFKVTAIDYATKTWSALQGFNGTTVASHADTAEIAPTFPGADPDTGETIIPMTLGAMTIDGVAHRIQTATITKDERLNARLDEWGERSHTGFRRPLEGRTVPVVFTAYQRETIGAVLAYSEREKAVALVFTVGDADDPIGGPELIFTLPQFRFDKPEKGESGGEFTRQFSGQGFATETPGNDGINLIVRAG